MTSDNVAVCNDPVSGSSPKRPARSQDGSRTDPPRRSTYDAIVIGGGPGGSCAASALAQRGRRVLVLERQQFPRYTIGESVIPLTYRILQRLGIFEDIDNAGFQEKWGFQFGSTSGRVSRPFYFNDAVRDPKFKTWNVERTTFDDMLLRHAQRCGAEVCERVTVLDALKERDRVVGVTYRTEHDHQERSVRADFVIDASGRAALLSRRFKYFVRDPTLDQMAVWRYVKDAYRQPGLDAGNIVVALLQNKGWFWWVPLANDSVSVGVVSSVRDMKQRGSTPREIFDRAVRECSIISEWIAPGEYVSDYQTCADYSYSSTHFAGDGWVSVGDAACFIDPVFSSGLYLSMCTGEMAAHIVDKALDTGDRSRAVFEQYERTFRRGEDTFRIFIDAFYDPNVSASRLLRENPQWHRDWGRVLLGDVFEDNRAFCEFLIDYRRALALEKGTSDTTRIHVPETWATRATLGAAPEQLRALAAAP